MKKYNSIDGRIHTNSRSVAQNLYLHGTTAWKIRKRSMLTCKSTVVPVSCPLMKQ